MKKEFLFFLFLIVLVILTQIILASKHAEFGFFTDDWLFLSLYRLYVSNPITDILYAWERIGSHNFAHSYYIGILHNFFGLNYSAYHTFNLSLKILATLTLYPLILVVFKNKLLAFLSTLFFAIHYSTYGTLDNASRGEGFIAIALMNLLLAVYFYLSRKPFFNIPVFMGISVWFFITILTDLTRVFPLIVFFPLIELFNIAVHRIPWSISLKRLLIIYFPFLILIFFYPTSVHEARYSVGLFDKIKTGNLQLFLTPFASIGSTYIPQNLWQLFGNPTYLTLETYINFVIRGPLVIFSFISIVLGFIISKKPLEFVARSLFFYIFSAGIVYILISRWIILDTKIRTPVDPGTFLIPSLIGIFVLLTGFSSFIEWRKNGKKGNLLPLIFLGPLVSLFYTTITWFFADLNSIFMGVHPYLNIPSIGTSIVFATITLLIYKKLKSSIFLGKNIIAGIVVIVIISSFFKISLINTERYFSYWLNNGLRASDQQKLMDQFWTEINSQKQYSLKNPPFFYLDTSEDLVNGTYYAEAMIWKIAAWLDLRYTKNKEGRFSQCQVVILEKSDLEKSFKKLNGNITVNRDNCGKSEGISFNIDNFYAFKMMNRNLVPNRKEVLDNLTNEEDLAD